MAITHLLNAGDHVISMDDVYGGFDEQYLNTCFATVSNDYVRSVAWLLLGPVTIS